MSRNRNKMRAEFHGTSWRFIDEVSGSVKFDQALMDATWSAPGIVEGYVKAVHGLEVGKSQGRFSIRSLGLTALPQLGRPQDFSGERHKRLRLNEDGTTEPADQHG